MLNINHDAKSLYEALGISKRELSKIVDDATEIAAGCMHLMMNNESFSVSVRWRNADRLTRAISMLLMTRYLIEDEPGGLVAIAVAKNTGITSAVDELPNNCKESHLIEWFYNHLDKIPPNTLIVSAASHAWSLVVNKVYNNIKEVILKGGFN